MCRPRRRCYCLQSEQRVARCLQNLWPMNTRQISSRKGDVCRAAVSVTVDETTAEQARRRAARWYAWLKSPECTFQDRENFERWRADVSNAAAYVAFCDELTTDADLADGREGRDYAANGYVSFVHSPRLEADQR
jgi:hypothetical protein